MEWQWMMTVLCQLPGRRHAFGTEPNVLNDGVVLIGFIFRNIWVLELNGEPHGDLMTDVTDHLWHGPKRE